MKSENDRMLILSNCLTESADEGSLKLASSLVKRIKNKYPDNTYVVTFEKEISCSDSHINLNKFHINAELISIIRKQKRPVLYIPFPAPMLSMVVRIFLLSIFSRKGLRVMMIRQYPLNWIARMLLRLSKAEIITFSKKAYDFYYSTVKGNVLYLKTGVDTSKFIPVSKQRARELKIKYGFDPERPIILHVGHMKEGRNIAELMKVDEKYQVLLVVSTLSKERQSMELKEQLSQHKNIRIMEGYISCIEEIYQLSDVYFFPVQKLGHCIDVPLSCLEAAACNKPIITTDYGEMSEFVNVKDFYFIGEMSSLEINKKIADALCNDNCSTRDCVIDYDYDNAIDKLSDI